MIKRVEFTFKLFLISVFGDIIFYLSKGTLLCRGFLPLALFTLGTFLLFLSLAFIMLKG